MTKPVVLRFSLRTDADAAPTDLVSRIEAAFGCQFIERDSHEVFRREAHILGMTIVFVPWVGIGLKPVYQLSGYTTANADWPGHETPEVVTLDEAIIDLLHRSEAAEWHQPTEEERNDEESSAAHSAMEDDDPGPPEDWPPP